MSVHVLLNLLNELNAKFAEHFIAFLQQFFMFDKIQ